MACTHGMHTQAMLMHDVHTSSPVSNNHSDNLNNHPDILNNHPDISNNHPDNLNNHPDNSNNHPDILNKHALYYLAHTHMRMRTYLIRVGINDQAHASALPLLELLGQLAIRPTFT